MCKTFFLTLCIYLVGRIVSDDKIPFRCGYRYVDSVDGWMKLQEIPANWHEARLRCHLEGVPLMHIPHSWAPSEPDNEGDQEGCLTMQFDGKLADEKCTDPLNYICYKKRTPDMVLNDCGTVDPKYIKYDRTNSCYKFHREPRTWSRAYMTCAAEGGYLVVINSEKEAGIIREIFAENLPGSMVGRFWKDVAFVGFHDWGEHGTWRTVQGQTLEEAGYAKFSPGEPNNSTGGEFCGAVYRSALFDDLWCENVYAFICEKDPVSLLCDDNNKAA